MSASLIVAASIHARMGFNDELHEPGTGWQLLGTGYRAYNPTLMRFTSIDALSPFAEGGLNAYAYCGNDPVNKRDLNGHFPTSILAIGVLATLALGVGATTLAATTSEKEITGVYAAVAALSFGATLLGVAAPVGGRSLLQRAVRLRSSRGALFIAGTPNRQFSHQGWAGDLPRYTARGSFEKMPGSSPPASRASPPELQHAQLRELRPTQWQIMETPVGVEWYEGVGSLGLRSSGRSTQSVSDAGVFQRHGAMRRKRQPMTLQVQRVRRGFSQD